MAWTDTAARRHYTTNLVYCLCSGTNYVSYERGPTGSVPPSMVTRQFRFSSVPSTHSVFKTGFINVAPSTVGSNNAPYHEYIFDVTSMNLASDVMFFTSLYSCQ